MHHCVDKWNCSQFPRLRVMNTTFLHIRTISEESLRGVSFHIYPFRLAVNAGVHECKQLSVHRNATRLPKRMAWCSLIFCVQSEYKRAKPIATATVCYGSVVTPDSASSDQVRKTMIVQKVQHLYTHKHMSTTYRSESIRQSHV